MNRIIGQKEIPDLVIDGIELNTASDFRVFTRNKKIDVIITLAVIPKLIKTKILNNELINTLLYVQEPVRLIDGSDDTDCWTMKIKNCTMNYSLGADGEPCRYYLTFRNYNNG
jgi:hypothetical protein